MRRGHIAILTIVITGVVILFQYCSSEKITNPITGKSARVALSSEQEEALGIASFREVLSQADVVERGPEHDLVVKVAERLARATGDDAKDFKWQVSVVKSPQANAFCLPGGKVVVYTGIIPYAKTEEGLAAVMGHEMAHAIARHGSQRLLRTSLAQTALAGASASLGDLDYREHGRAWRRGAIRCPAAIQPRARNGSGSDGFDLHGARGLRPSRGDFILGTNESSRPVAAAGVCIYSSLASATHPRPGSLLTKSCFGIH